MARPISLRSDFSRGRSSSRGAANANPARRLLSLAAIDDGGTRGEVARIGGVGLEIVGNDVVRFNAGSMDGRDRAQGRLRRAEAQR